MIGTLLLLGAVALLGGGLVATIRSNRRGKHGENSGSHWSFDGGGGDADGCGGDGGGGCD